MCEEIYNSDNMSDEELEILTSPDNDTEAMYHNSNECKEKVFTEDYLQRSDHDLVTPYTEKIQSREDEITKNNEKITELNNKIKDMKAQIKSYQARNTALTKEITQLKKDEISDAVLDKGLDLAALMEILTKCRE